MGCCWMGLPLPMDLLASTDFRKQKGLQVSCAALQIVGQDLLVGFEVVCTLPDDLGFPDRNILTFLGLQQRHIFPTNKALFFFAFLGSPQCP